MVTESFFEVQVPNSIIASKLNNFRWFKVAVRYVVFTEIIFF